ncbi:MAG: LamG domain-containing protein, partial [Bernardetiaceae bacterium]|nr:LamG domain-containing protein [Bernardetiaceae bacterium]
MAQLPIGLVARYTFDAPAPLQQEAGGPSALDGSIPPPNGTPPFTWQFPDRINDRLCGDLSAIRFVGKRPGTILNPGAFTPNDQSIMFDTTALNIPLRSAGGEDFSVSFWFRTNLKPFFNAAANHVNGRSLISSEIRPFENSDFTVNLHGTSVAGNTGVHFYVCNAQVAVTPAGNDYADGRWHHVVVTYDTDLSLPLSGTATGSLYIDNVLINTDINLPKSVPANATGPDKSIRPFFSQIYLGRYSWTGPDDSFQGALVTSAELGNTFCDMDDLQFYNRSLTAGDVAQIYGLPGGDVVVSTNIPSSSLGGTTFNNLTVNAGATLTIDNNISVIGNLNNNGTIVVQAGRALTLSGSGAVNNSGAISVARTGSLVQSPCSARLGSGSYTITTQSQFNQGGGESTDITRFRYNYWSSPVTNATTSVFTDYFRHPDFFGSAIPAIFTLNNGVDIDGEIGTYEGYNGLWIPQAAGASMSPGVGLAVAGGGNVIFTGPVNNAPTALGAGNTIEVPINRVTSTSLTDWDGFNLVGNPFPSPISVERFLNTNGPLLAAGTGVYLWLDDDNNNTVRAGGVTNDYANCTAAACTPFLFPAASGNTDLTSTNPYVPVAQGFLIRKAANGTSQLQFTNGMRRTASLGTIANTRFFRGEEDPATTFMGKTIERVWLRLANSANQRNELAFAFQEGFTQGIDHTLDGIKNEGNANISFYSLGA